MIFEIDVSRSTANGRMMISKFRTNPLVIHDISENDTTIAIMHIQMYLSNGSINTGFQLSPLTP